MNLLHVIVKNSVIGFSYSEVPLSVYGKEICEKSLIVIYWGLKLAMSFFSSLSSLAKRVLSLIHTISQENVTSNLIEIHSGKQQR